VHVSTLPPTKPRGKRIGEAGLSYDARAVGVRTPAIAVNLAFDNNPRETSATAEENLWLSVETRRPYLSHS
jgi:hypothetical protein